MPNETTYAGVFGDLQRFTDAMETNLAELPHLQGPYERMQTLLTRGYDIAKQQAALTAAKQEMSRQLRVCRRSPQSVGN
ncbi:MAG TPA: hypothetical protein VE685_22065 [Thermoanaerobaculia bacterium]|nr:hypothetical protein [Thermoanaerobaculia bacterium]